MRRRVFAALVAAAILAGPAVSHAAAASQLVVQGVDTAAYPKVKLTLGIPAELQGSGLAPEHVRVLENGREADGAAVANASASAEQAADVVLLVDTSGSMQGAAIESAKRAALAFVQALTGTSRVAVIGFSSKPRLATGYTDDKTRLESAISGLGASGETAMYDAIGDALDLVPAGAHTRANIVLLSDGGDTASAATLDSIVQRLHKVRVPVYAVALPSAEANAGALRTLASQSGGRMLSVTDASKLTALYQGIAREIGNRWTITFTGRRPNTTQLDIEVLATVGGKQVRGVAVVANPQFAELADMGSGTGLKEITPANPIYLLAAVVLAFVAVAALVSAVMLLASRPETTMEQLRYYEQLRGGMDSLPGADDADEAGVRARMLGAVEYVAGKRGMTQFVAEKLERAGLPLRPAEYIAAHLLAVVIGGVLVQVLTKSAMLAFLAVAFATIGPMLWVQTKVEHRRTRFDEQLPELLTLVAGSLRAGWGMQQAVDLVVQEMGDPAASEFRRVQVETRLGLELDESLAAMAERLDSDDFRSVVTAISVQREVGGNLAEVLDIVANTIRERESLRRQVHALTAEGRLSAIILVVLPFLLLGALMVISPEYITSLLSSAFGVMLAVSGALLLVVGIVWLMKVSKVEV